MKKTKFGVLFSGGKDSCLALKHSLESGQVMCLITLVSENPYSFMFHTPNIDLAKMQAGAIGLPIIIQNTKGMKEEELKDLEKAIQEAKKKYGIQGIATGAVASVYQASRIKKICDKLGIECFNPLWGKDQIEVLNEIVKEKFDVIIMGVFALGMDKLLGKKIDKTFIQDIKKLQDKYGINPAGEGGEFESLVLDAPFFKKKIVIKKSHELGKEDSKILKIDEIKLEKKVVIKSKR
jgi:diphthine-ammonia ligase